MRARTVAGAVLLVLGCGTDGVEVGTEKGPCYPNGTCNDGLECLSETCVKPPACVPSCGGRECGPDGCGGSCGYCQVNETCNTNGICIKVTTCTPNCSGKQCGDDGCGGDCGTCDPGSYCDSSHDCIPVSIDVVEETVGIDVPPPDAKEDEGIPVDVKDLPSDETTAIDTPYDAETVVPELPPPDAVPDLPAEACLSNCTGKQCGDDGCGGSCGDCADPTKPVCKAGTCIASTCTLPTTWGHVGVVALMETPGTADADFIKNSCPDFSGDGNGDNGLKSLATTLNPEIKKALDGGDFGIAFEFRAVSDFSNTPSFILAGLIGKPDATISNQFQVEPTSFKVDTPSGECAPMMAFDTAKIISGSMSAGPNMFVVSIPFVDLGGVLSFTIESAQVKAAITDGGVNATNGVLAGVLKKSEVDATLAKLEAQCAVNPTDICSYLGTAKAFLPMLFDLDQNKDGKKDAASICLRFTTKAGVVEGFLPEGATLSCGCSAGLRPVQVGMGPWVVVALGIVLFVWNRRAPLPPRGTGGPALPARAATGASAGLRGASGGLAEDNPLGQRLETRTSEPHLLRHLGGSPNGAISHLSRTS
jgi:hypothetical protein